MPPHARTVNAVHQPAPRNLEYRYMFCRLPRAIVRERAAARRHKRVTTFELRGGNATRLPNAAGLEVEMQAAADAVDVAVGAGNHGVDARGDVVDHEPHLRVEIPIDAERDVVLMAGAGAARSRGEH